MRLQIKKIGNSTGLILPKELLQRLGLQQGDEVIVTETPEGLQIAAYAEEDDETMQIARRVMKKYAGTLRALAK